MNAQTIGLALLALGAAALWSPWALVIAGALLVFVPELAAAVRRAR